MSMRKFKVGMAAVLILGIVALFFVVNAFAQSASERLNCPSGALSIFDVQEGINVECVNAPFATLTPVVEPTDTPIPPTDIPPTPIHDNRAWHPVSADISHEHKDNPHDADDVFGTQFYEWAGGEISHPWQTFRPPGGPGNMENDIKHEGYGWLVEKDIPIENDFTWGPRDYGISDFRMEYHGIFATPGSVTRFHSNWLEARLCYKPTDTCGIIRAGGHPDFGNLFIDDDYIPLPGDNPAAANPFSGRGKRSHFIEGHEIWYTDQQPDSNPTANNYVRFSIIAGDPWGPLNPADPYELTFYCPDYDCESNGSRVRVNHITIDLTSFEPDETGLINISSHTDRYGNIVECSVLGTDCIPFEISGVVPAKYDYEFRSQGPGPATEQDISPPGEFWIAYPN